jgi:hypothetical protein
MKINADGIDRDATETEIAEIEFVRSTYFDIAKDLQQRETARKSIADKLGLTAEELSALLA